jgi:hypothetical protein
MAMLSPLFLNMSTSFGMSPIVAICSGEMDSAWDKTATLPTSRCTSASHRATPEWSSLTPTIFGHTFQVCGEIRNNHGREPHCPLFTSDVWTAVVAHHPGTIGVNPAIKSVTHDRPDNLGCVVRRHKALSHHRQVGMNEHAAVEGCDRFCEGERF